MLTDFFKAPFKMFNENYSLGTSLVVQWLRLHASNAGGTGLIPGQGSKIPHGERPKKERGVSLLMNKIKYSALNKFLFETGGLS